MVTPDFEKQAEAWSSPPVDHLNEYVSSRKLLELSPAELRRLIAKMASERYGGWRNHNGVWTDVLLADVTGKRVLDYGCGVGLESLSLARRGAQVIIADISADNVALAEQVLFAHNLEHHGIYDIQERPPLTRVELGSLDILYCNGVLHHVPDPALVIQHAWDLLKPGGEVRLMLYTSQCWTNQTGTEPPQSDTQSHPRYRDFLTAMDRVGAWVEFYSPDRLVEWFGRWFELEKWVYMTPWNNYAAAILRRKDDAE